jgi:excisionase family DNA binding protein
MATDSATGRTFTVADLCERFGVGEHTVLGWIRSGELKAMNVGRSPGGKKPRWRISAEAVSDFELRRTPAPAAMTPQRRRRIASSVIKFF